MLTIRISRRAAFLVLVGAILVIPAVGWASHRFNDVADSNIFHDDITWLADADVTKGCNPPANDQFCPSDSVTREQMAAFMRRLAQFLDAEDGTPGQADNAANADQLDGLDSTDILRRTPAAQALISLTPDVERGFGITDVSRVGTGVYCLELDSSLSLTEADIIVSVTVDWFASFGNDLFAQWSSSSFGTCAADEFMVRTFDDSAGITLSDDVRFSVIVFEDDPSGLLGLSEHRTAPRGANGS